MPKRDIIEEAIGHLEAGALERTEALCDGLLRDDGARPDALQVLALVAQHRGDLELGLARFGAAVELDPTNNTRRLNFGLFCYEVGADHLCVAHLERVLVRNYAPEGLHCLGRALLRLGHPGPARSRLRRAALEWPAEATFWSSLGEACLALGEGSNAAAAYGAAAALQPEHAQTHFDLGVAWLAAGRPGEALEAFDDALLLDPEHARAHLQRGVALKRLGHFDEALDAQRLALSLCPDPEATWQLALTELLVGDFAAGFDHLQARLDDAEQTWDGSPLPGGHLAVLASTSTGDTLQFLRFVARAAERCGWVTLHVRADLVPLLQRSYIGPAGIAPLPAPGERTGADATVSLCSLPHVLGIGGEVGIGAPYLALDGEAVADYAAGISRHGLRIGLCCEGDPAHEADGVCSIPCDELRPLMQLQEVRFYSVSSGHDAGGLSLCQPPLIDMGDIDVEGETFVETAALLGALDLLITGDAAVAHLAGALGLEVWLLLPHVPDFRWGLHAERWYPRLRVLRQHTPGDWASVVNEVRDALTARGAHVAA